MSRSRLLSRGSAALAGAAVLAAICVPAGAVPVGPPEPPSVTGVDASADVTVADLQAMFPGRVGNADIVAEGLPSLNKAMRDAGITTPARRAAFLTTIAYESAFLYNVTAAGDTRVYAGRGFIQLTGEYNYKAAGSYFGIRLAANPAWARSLPWSAPIAQWYWTVNRDMNPMADALDMGLVNAAIGYPPGPHDEMRCASFQAALAYYLGSVPAGVNCVRPESYLSITTSTSHLSRAQWEALGDSE